MSHIFPCTPEGGKIRIMVKPQLNPMEKFTRCNILNSWVVKHISLMNTFAVMHWLHASKMLLTIRCNLCEFQLEYLNNYICCQEIISILVRYKHMHLCGVGV